MRSMRCLRAIPSHNTLIPVVFLAAAIASGCSHNDPRGPFERAGAAVDSATVKVAKGAKEVGHTVAEAVGDAANWVEEKVAPEEAQTANSSATDITPADPTPTPMPDFDRY